MAYAVPILTVVSLKAEPAPGTPICVEVLEEHVQIHQIDERHLSKVIVVQLNVTINEEGG